MSDYSFPAGDTLQAVSGEVEICTRCKLCEGRKRAVPGEGPSAARIMLVGEAPGRQEDEVGRPFVGAAGKLLTELLEASELRREEVYITNVVKCRPPENRPPFEAEAEACKSYLDRQIALIKPRIICPMGNSAIRTMLDTEKTVSQLHGARTARNGLAYFPLYHPAAAIYDRRLRKVLAADFAKLRDLVA